MINAKIAKIFYQMAGYYQMKDDQFRPRAYERGARLVESMDADLAEIFEKGGVKALTEIPGIGQGMAQQIEEYIQTGKIGNLEKLKKEIPVDLESFEAIEGVGPKMIKALYHNLGIKNIKDLEKAALAQKIRKLPHFGEKTEENILRSIELSREHRGRFLLGYILPIVSEMEQVIRQIPGVKSVMTCGSIRRRKETVGDIDMLVASTEPETVMEYFTSGANVERVIAKGGTKSSVRLDIGIDADLRVVSESSIGAAMQYFTGSKDHNVELRKIAIKNDCKLNEYGMFDSHERQIGGKTEEEIYKKLGLQWIPPEMRENRGEIGAALQNKLPKIVDYSDVISDLQMHTTFSDGAHTVREMAETAKKLGRKYIAITDHVGHLKIAGAMDIKTIEKQWKEIERVNKQISGIKILKACEVDINPDGSIALSDEYLQKFDLVLGSIHSNFKMKKSEMTQRLIRAIENPHIDIISHPTGRVIHRRAGYEFDFAAICETAARTKTILEINAYPDRLDLDDLMAAQAIKSGVKLSIGTDSHSKTQLHNLELGIAQARRAWATKADIINCLDVADLLGWIKSK